MRRGVRRGGRGSAGIDALILGIVGLVGQIISLGTAGVIFLPCSVAAWSLGQRELQRTRALGLPAGDLRSARTGYYLGILGVLLAALAVVTVVLIVVIAAFAHSFDPIRVNLLTDW